MSRGSDVTRMVIDEWSALDDTLPLSSNDDIARRVGCEPPTSEPGDRFERDQVDIAMYWPEVRP